MQMSRILRCETASKSPLEQAPQTAVAEPVEPKTLLPAVPCESRWDFEFACYLRPINVHLDGKCVLLMQICSPSR